MLDHHNYNGRIRIKIKILDFGAILFLKITTARVLFFTISIIGFGNESIRKRKCFLIDILFSSVPCDAKKVFEPALLLLELDGPVKNGGASLDNRPGGYYTRPQK